MTAPKANHTNKDRRVPLSSVKRRPSSSLWWAMLPNAMPPTKAAMKPFVPAVTAHE